MPSFKKTKRMKSSPPVFIRRNSIVMGKKEATELAESLMSAANSKNELHDLVIVRINILNAHASTLLDSDDIKALHKANDRLSRRRNVMSGEDFINELEAKVRRKK